MFIDTMRAYCKAIDYERTKEEIFHHLHSEVVELEIETLDDHIDGRAIVPEDGVFGESIDVIVCAFDLIFKDRPDASNEEIMAYAIKKLEKWKTKYNNVDRQPS